MKHLIWLALGALWPLAAVATSTLPPHAVVVTSDTWPAANVRAQAPANEALAHIAAGDAKLALQRLRAESDPVRFEAAAAQVVDALQAGSPSSAGDQVLAALEREPVRVFQRHEETAADWFLPVFNVPARAASARELIAFAQQRDALRAKLERDPDTLASAPTPAVLSAAIEGLTPKAVEALATAALRDPERLPSAAWAALARRQPSQDVLDASLHHAQPVDVLPLLQDLPERVDPERALAWLKRAAQTPQLASGAVLGLGRLVPRLPKAETELAAHLGDPLTGASAAAALAQMQDEDRLERIGAWVKRAQTPAQLNDLALALRLEGSPDALRRLQRLAADPRVSESLRKELQR